MSAGQASTTKEPSRTDLVAVFREGWPRARSNGWHAVKGRGLQVAYVYVRPGVSIENGVEGRDFFVGDGAFSSWRLANRVIGIAASAQDVPDEVSESLTNLVDTLAEPR